MVVSLRAAKMHILKNSKGEFCAGKSVTWQSWRLTSFDCQGKLSPLVTQSRGTSSGYEKGLSELNHQMPKITAGSAISHKSLGQGEETRISMINTTRCTNNRMETR
ncbi:hypothetical protein KIL84_022455 [Mauremys mutica]|uniref:Uncharacterized protein n=1 Tax=Mauremys mutica TaxID=74926 RepID=A0A9D4AQM2_9SAUR|nr:hypothetical protein KIL84_022455 [Mauremys mutica]